MHKKMVEDDANKSNNVVERTLAKLRLRRDEARNNKHGLRSSALFFAENCLVMSSALVVASSSSKTEENEDAKETLEAMKKSDAYAFASILHEDGQHVRAMEIMKKEREYLEAFGEMSVLASRCLYKSRKFDE